MKHLQMLKLEVFFLQLTQIFTCLKIQRGGATKNNNMAIGPCTQLPLLLNAFMFKKKTTVAYEMLHVNVKTKCNVTLLQN